MKKVWAKPELRILSVEMTQSGTQEYWTETLFGACHGVTAQCAS